MSNLLPPKHKKLVKREYLARFMTLFLVFLAITFLISLIFSIPSYFLSLNKISLAKERIDFLSSYIEKRGSPDTTLVLIPTNQKIDALINDKELELSKSIERILDKKRNSIKITGIAFNNPSSLGKIISITGIASNRDNLISFADSLESVVGFVEVDLPVSNLAKNTNVDFDIEIKINSILEE